MSLYNYEHAQYFTPQTHKTNKTMRLSIHFLFLVISIFSFKLNAQNVGIGTNTPTNKLEVVGWIEIGDETQGGTNMEGTMRYHSGKNCIEVFDGTFWDCADISEINEITIYDGFNQGTGAATWAAGGYASIYNFSIPNCYPYQLVHFTLEVFIGDLHVRNPTYCSCWKIYTAGIFVERQLVNIGGNERRMV